MNPSTFVRQEGQSRSDAYRRLAARLDALPNGFPPAPDGAELRLLEKLFSAEEAELAAALSQELEMPEVIAARLGSTGAAPEPQVMREQLKAMARKGLIAAGRTSEGLKYRLMPFVVGIYEAQNGRIDAELARLFEDYYQQAFRQMLTIQPAFHRVVPVGESVRMDMEIRPHESAREIVEKAKAWGVLDCICRVQKRLIGEGCEHPVDVCMVIADKPGIFDHSPVIRALTLEEALATLQRAARAGLVHSVSNVQEEISYICNCCTCSCGIMRGVAELGMVNVVARSPFVNQVDEALCSGCEACVDACVFKALALSEGLMQVNRLRCAGCGVCISVCPSEALSLVRRPEEEILSVPQREADWGRQRSQARGILRN
jgi:Pyruvate/2-oxoacid:ferredoxin oxidoreductase delta subunit